jgi:hypothetical protein
MGVPCIALGAAAFSLTALSVKLMSQKAHADGTRFVPVTETATFPSALCFLMNSVILMAMPANHTTCYEIWGMQASCSGRSVSQATCDACKAAVSII